MKIPKAYYYLGKQYYYEYGVKKDIKKSPEYLKKGCKLNKPKACNGLEWIYQHNKKYKNIPLAVKYFKKACNELKYGTLYPSSILLRSIEGRISNDITLLFSTLSPRFSLIFPTAILFYSNLF